MEHTGHVLPRALVRDDHASDLALLETESKPDVILLIYASTVSELWCIPFRAVLPELLDLNGERAVESSKLM